MTQCALRGKVIYMNKKVIYISLAVILALGAAWIYFRSHNSVNPPASNNAADEQAIRAMVLEFGTKLKNVPLSGTKEAAIQAIRENYGPYVSPELLAAWEADPIKAPGRLTSSPWPERIEILEITKSDDGSYEVQGKVLEITSAEAISGGVASQYGVAMKIRNRDGKWIITGFTKAIAQ